VAAQVSDGLPLDAGQRPGEGEFLPGPGRTLICDPQAVVGLSSQSRDRAEQATGQDQPAIDGLIEAVQEPGTFQMEARIRCRS